MKGLYSFFWDCGRMGEVSGTFIADSEEVAKAIGKSVYFGEILGKHSEVFGTLDEGDIELKTDNQEFITMFESILGENWSTGYNPLDYLPEDKE
jgi:hypothetical protein